MTIADAIVIGGDFYDCPGTTRAGQLGYRTTEITVTRACPAGEATPTKVGGFSGRIDMLEELIAVALGRFNPP